MALMRSLPVACRGVDPAHPVRSDPFAERFGARHGRLLVPRPSTPGTSVLTVRVPRVTCTDTREIFDSRKRSVPSRFGRSVRGRTRSVGGVVKYAVKC